MMSWLAPQIIICSLTMSILTLAFFGIRKLLEQKQSARWRYAVWWILGIGFLTPLKPQLGGALFELPSPYRSVDVYSPQGYYAYTVTDPSVNLWRILLVIWVFGAVFSFCRMLSRQHHFSRSVKRLSRPADEVAQTVYQLVCMDMEIPAYAEVSVLPVISTPMMTGLWNPRILLPDTAYSSEELRLIFKHELTHYMRGDLWCKLLWMGCTVLHWFNPLMPKFIRMMEQDCEMACDEAVLRGESEETAAAYCDTILDTAMRRCRAKSQNIILATNFSGSKENLRSRIHAILFRSRKRRFMIVFLAAAWLTLLTGSLIAYADSARGAESAMVREVLTDESGFEYEFTEVYPEYTYTTAPADYGYPMIMTEIEEVIVEEYDMGYPVTQIFEETIPYYAETTVIPYEYDIPIVQEAPRTYP